MPICRICGRQSSDTFEAFGFQWLKCRECCSIQKDISEASYRSLTPTYDPGNYLDSKSHEEISAYLEVRSKTVFLRNALAAAGLQDRPGLRMLDVGCGMGGFMLAAKLLGCSATGFEPSLEHARVAKEILKLDVINDYFSPEKVQGPVDLIVLSHVIEHIYNPQEFINSLIGCLSPGGLLLVITPNAASSIASLCGRYWPMLRPVDHVTMISARTYQGMRLQAKVTHKWSGYTHELATTLLSSLRSRFSGAAPAGKSPSSRVPLLPAPSLAGKAFRAAMTILSAPALLSPEDKKPCLITFIQRK